MFEKVIIGYDNHGFELIEFITKALNKIGQPFKILDCSGKDYVDAVKLALEKRSVKDGIILICGTGVGVSMVANKYKGIRAALCMSPETAYFARKHENANCLCLASSYSDGVKKIKLSGAKAENIITTFFTTDFEGGRHLERINRYSELGEKIGR